MQQLNRLQNTVYQIGGFLLLIGAILPALMPSSSLGAWIFAAGCVMFVSMQFMQRYLGGNIVIRRLRRQQLLGGMMLLVSATLLLAGSYWPLPLAHGSWKFFLLIGAVLELYTAFRIPAELHKEKQL